MVGDFQIADWAALLFPVAIWIAYGRFADALPQPLPSRATSTPPCNDVRYP
jgi:hypothetical protein